MKGSRFTIILEAERTICQFKGPTILTKVAFSKSFSMETNSLSQFQSCFSRHGPGTPLLLIGWNVLLQFKAHEVDCEFHCRKITLLQKSHPQNSSVEIQGYFRVLDTVHCLLEQEILRATGMQEKKGDKHVSLK